MSSARLRRLNPFAGIQRALGKPDAKDTAQRALDTLVATLGADHPRVQRRGPLLCHIASGALPGGEPSGPEAALAAAILEGRAAMEAHDFARAAAHLLPVAESAHTAGNPAAEGAARSLLAQALALIGRREDAILQARRALTLAEELYDDDAVQEFGQLLAMFESGNPISEAHAPPPIPTDGPCPCGSGVPFRACHGAPDDGA